MIQMLGFSPEVADAAARIRETWTEKDYRERWGRGLDQPYEIPQYGWLGDSTPSLPFLGDQVESASPVLIGIEIAEIEF
jgi:hypothetical protein